MSWKSQFRYALTVALVAFAFGFVQACGPDSPTAPQRPAADGGQDTCILLNGVWHCAS